MVFSILLAKNISIAEKLATKEEWSLLLGLDKISNIDEDDQNKPNWMSHRTWMRIKRLE